ncbi:MAG: RdgB/HAM1 family non-canonical purine NTP pyrophosphatase [Candidatus Symbiodolus clandestinus]
MSKPIVLATGNSGKIAELTPVLQNLGLNPIPQSQWSIPTVAENGMTFVENALLKARHCAQHTGIPVLADDAGLVVDALQGAPGLYSARYAGESASDLDNNLKLLQQLQLLPTANRSAHFYCVLVYLSHATNPAPLIAEGRWQGQIAYQPLGDQGFGYDPLFYLPEQHCSAAQLSREQKNQLSHRGQALRRLLAALTDA